MTGRKVHPLRDEILSLRREGLSYGAIAKRLDVTRNVVAGVLNRCEDYQPDEAMAHHRGEKLTFYKSHIYFSLASAARHTGDSLYAIRKRAISLDRDGTQ